MTAVTRIALLFFLALLLSCGDSASRSVDIAIEHVTLIDAINPIRENHTVLIDKGRIVAIVDSDTTENVSAQKTVDGSGQTLIPGLWDFHVHFTFDKRFTDAMAGLFLYHGVTNVRDTGGLLKDLLPVVDTLRSAGDNARASGTRARCSMAPMSSTTASTSRGWALPTRRRRPRAPISPRSTPPGRAF